MLGLNRSWFFLSLTKHHQELYRTKNRKAGISLATLAVWFREDTLHDHIALKQALDQAAADDKILLLFHINPEMNDTFTPRYDY